MATVGGIVLDADAFRAAYPHWPAPEPDVEVVLVSVAGRSFTLLDAVLARCVLLEHRAGRAEDAARVAKAADLGGLTVAELEGLCAAFEVEIDEPEGAEA